MKVRAQFALVFNMDKCIGCHTCSVTCKNVWTNRRGAEYMWWNNVESKPGIGYPKQWEDQNKWRGGWSVENGKLELRAGGRATKLLNIFANPDLPEIDDYYDPFTYNYAHLQNARLLEATPTARPMSQITGEQIEKITWGPNWEDHLAGEFESRSRDANFQAVEKQIYAQFENTFQLYLPRICNHCLNPACVAACPSGSIYKREEDGIVLVDQDKCRGWRMCVSACPYKKVFYNWESGKAEKCIGCYPRVESGMPTVCSESCVGRIRYNGILLYDADKIAEYAATPNDKDVYKAHLKIFLDPNDPEVVAAARRDGIPEDWIEAARRSPIWKMAMEWKIAFPMHPEFRTLPMVWYVPPLSPVQSALDQKTLPTEADGVIPKYETLRTPTRFLANLLTAGDEAPIRQALSKLIAMRSYQRSKHVDGAQEMSALQNVGLTAEQADAMYRLLAIADYNDRFVIPTSHAEVPLEDAYGFQGQNGFSFGNDDAVGISSVTLFPRRRIETVEPKEPAPLADEIAK
ncbi:nitrate reductase subunit beta [Sulfuricystis multivorans]|uniref:nitrate reductase subunit beta n=1 Tax=Sulfuricystis multivorans TaxID=2211108 RepID=UPI000F819940|nr:nitrate reductase subunit beta [Sulfuricystis multivorans]